MRQTIESIRRVQAEERHEVEADPLKVVEELNGVKTFGQQLVQSLQGADTPFVRGELERLDGRRGSWRPGSEN